MKIEIIGSLSAPLVACNFERNMLLEQKEI